MCIRDRPAARLAVLDCNRPARRGIAVLPGDLRGARGRRSDRDRSAASGQAWQGVIVTRAMVSLIEGDGIGPEITAATVRAIAAAGGELDWEPVSYTHLTLPTSD